jgi:serine/threonine protein phosphatase PrpC
LSAPLGGSVNQFVEVDNLDIGSHTDIGRRARNEDSLLIDRDLGLVVVADGVGGHHGGEIASGLACEVLQREVAAGSSPSKAINQANTEILEAEMAGRGKSGMASTVVAVLLTQNGYEIAWLGDSRVYLWDGKLSLLTRDHSFVEEQLASGKISFEEARTHPRRNVIFQAVGLDKEVNLDIGTNSGELAPDSCLLLCSDGISDPLDYKQLAELLSCRTNADETCRRMVSAALHSGGQDNATVVLIAHNGKPDDSSRLAEPDNVVWVYDPTTEVLTGLSDISMRNRDTLIASTRTPAGTGRYFWLAALLGTIAIGLV